MKNKMPLLIAIVVAIVLVLGIIVIKVNDNKKDESTGYLDNMSNVQYIKLEYSNKTEKLNNDLAVMLTDMSSDSLKKDSELNSDGNSTGQQAYCFTFYDKDNVELYRIQFYDGSNDMLIYREENSIIESYRIENDKILNYVLEQINEFNESL